MQTRYFALVFGIIYVAVGILGFIPGALAPAVDAPPLAVETLAGRLLGLFPVNVLHTLFHLLVGIWGILAYRSYGASRGYARSLAVIYGLLAILGLIPATSTLFGFAPLFGHDIWLHAGTAIIAAYFGWKKPEPAVDTTIAGGRV